MISFNCTASSWWLSHQSCPSENASGAPRSWRRLQSGLWRRFHNGFRKKTKKCQVSRKSPLYTPRSENCLPLCLSVGLNPASSAPCVLVVRYIWIFGMKRLKNVTFFKTCSHFLWCTVLIRWIYVNFPYQLKIKPFWSQRMKDLLEICINIYSFF